MNERKMNGTVSEAHPAMFILHAVESDCNPKRKRGHKSCPRLRFGLQCPQQKCIVSARVRYNVYFKNGRTYCELPNGEYSLTPPPPPEKAGP